MPDLINPRFLSAAALVAGGPGPLQQRLWAVWVNHLRGVAEQDLPEKLAAIYRELLREATCHADPRDPGTFAATVFSMSDDEAVGHAERLRGLCLSLARRG